jgi:hypothetical protein
MWLGAMPDQPSARLREGGFEVGFRDRSRFLPANDSSRPMPRSVGGCCGLLPVEACDR